MKKIFITIGLLIPVLFFEACNTNDNDSVKRAEQQNENKDSVITKTTDMTQGDSNFVVEAYNGGLKEIDLGQLAQKKGIDPAVKNFGKTLLEDHTEANKKLTEIAEMYRVAIPTTLGEQARKHIAFIDSKAGVNFDYAFIEHMVEDHKEDIRKFEAASTDSENERLRAFATQTLPTLRKHLQIAEKIHKTLKQQQKK